jgi:hypothetical protein
MNSKTNQESKDEELDPSFLSSLTEVVNEFKSESDRAAVILGAAKLDYILYQILTKYFAPNVGSRDELLEGDSPLATFSSKINICYRLGLIDAEFTRALHLIRKIRNSFAHEVSGCKLDSGPHRDRVRELTASFVNDKHFKNFKSGYFSKKEGSAANFLTMLVLMIARLEGLYMRLKPIEVKNARTVLPIASPGQVLETNIATEEPLKEQTETSTPRA